MRKAVCLFAVVVYAAVWLAGSSQLVVASDLDSVAKSKKCALSLDQAQFAFKARLYDEAIDGAKQVLAVSKNIDERNAAYTLLIISVRSMQGYKAAIIRAENVSAFILKTRPSSTKEHICLKKILADLKRRRAGYEKTIAEQKKIINTQPKSEKAAEAALKIAVCKQALGSAKDALSAYREVVRGYPLMRSSWKAAQELAWLRQSENGWHRKVDNDPELLIRNAMAKSGYEQASKQAWEMACGDKDFSPSYSDVLRLEAIVFDLARENAPSRETKTAKSIEPEQAADNAEAPQEVYASDDSSSSVSDGDEAASSSGTVSDFGTALPNVGAWTVRGSKTKQSDSKKRKAKASSDSSDGQDQEDCDSDNDAVLPNPSSDHLGSPFNQWTCAKEYREAGDDHEALRTLVSSHVERAHQLIKLGDNSDKQTGLGVMLGAALCASSALGDNALAISIADTYVMPNLSAADTASYRYLSIQRVLDKLVVVWTRAGESQKAIDTLTDFLKESSGTQADVTHLKLARILSSANRFDEAITHLNAISDSSDISGAKQWADELKSKTEGSTTR